MPEVVKNFGEHKFKGEFIAFLKLVAADRIPIDNINIYNSSSSVIRRSEVVLFGKHQNHDLSRNHKAILEDRHETLRRKLS